MSGSSVADFYGKTTNVGVDCGGTTATTVNVSGTTINEGGTTNNNTFTTVNNTATTINNKTTNFNVTGTTYISGNTTISGTCTIGDTLIVKEGLEKKLSWSYGDTCNASSGSTNFKNDASFVIPKCVSNLGRATLKWQKGAQNAGSYDPGSKCNCSGELNGTINIPGELSDLTDWSSNCLNVNNNLCVNGTVTATGGMYTSSDRDLKENIEYVFGGDIHKASKITFKTFNYKTDASKRKTYGVIAQDIEAIGLGELVHFDEEGKRAVDYTGLLILKVLQLEKEIKSLQFKLDELSKKD